MNWKIPLFKIYQDKEDLQKVTDVIKSGMHWAEGPSIKKFEDGITKYIGSKHCIVFNSGTSALHALLLAYGIKGQDEVIVPSFTFIATANAPLFVGARPVFADIEEETLGMDPEDVKKKITAKTKAIIAVHYGGCPCRIEGLKRVAREHRLILIEDAAEAFGATIRNRKAGTFADAAVFSFCQNKIITTGEGGAVVTGSTRIYESLRLIRSHGRLEKENYFSSTKPLDYIGIGYNFRMPSFVAGLGLAQLRKTEKIIRMRRANARYLNKKLSKEIKELGLPIPPGDYSHVYQLYTLRVKRNRDRLKEYLASRGIMTKIYFPPVHLTTFYQNMLKGRHSLPITEKVSQEALSLPMYPGLKKEEMDYVAGQIITFLRRRNE